MRNSTPTDLGTPSAAKLVDVGSLGSYFESLSDPRHDRNRNHLPAAIAAIAVIAVCGILCGCDGPTATHRWAKHRAFGLGLALALAEWGGLPLRIVRELVELGSPGGVLGLEDLDPRFPCGEFREQRGDDRHPVGFAQPGDFLEGRHHADG